ncbi:radical SAM protein [Helicobacter zhangjianzhongii]|uniref:radical SAM protein n=1 Tax=Helicobacter zhangjianzhongii TaxID=2974574 RepID=UPI0025575C71|nr:radical SAM protein [Helicobacter sp. CPD2-1]MDL0080267.1 radical SAM protein [Helicobacter sp. CPD2-1]
MKKSLAKRLYSKLARVAIAKLPESTYKEALMKRYVNVISNIVVIVGQNCTLKCQDCANFSPYLSKILPFYPAQEIIADMQELIKEAQIAYLQFQGGEFFYHPDAREILAFAVQSPRIHSICIATNATIIPKDSMLELLASPKVIVRISNYGQVNAKTATKLEEVLQARGIAVILRNTYRGAGLWSKCGDKDTKQLPSKAMQKVFDSCTFAKECLTMENGFITRCSRGTIAHIMQGFRLGGGDGVVVRPSAARAFETIHPEANEANADKYRQTGGGGNLCRFLPTKACRDLSQIISLSQRATIAMAARVCR